MWDEAYTSVCRRHPDVVAAFESPHGRVALLLRQTLTPPSEERSRWLVETRRAAREVTTSLRDAGLRHDVTILQWLPLPRRLRSWLVGTAATKENNARAAKHAGRKTAARTSW
jgi:hypothetical protein